MIMIVSTFYRRYCWIFSPSYDGDSYWPESGQNGRWIAVHDVSLIQAFLSKLDRNAWINEVSGHDGRHQATNGRLHRLESYGRDHK